MGVECRRKVERTKVLCIYSKFFTLSVHFFETLGTGEVGELC
jgi:hypothetical protein